MASTVTKNNAINDTASTTEGSPITIAVLANDVPNAAPKTLVSVSNTKLGASVKIVGGEVFYDPTNDPTIQALAQGETATDTFTYIMKEGSKLYTATVTVNLTGVNDAPIISGTKSGQTTTDTAAINPFATASVGDVDHGALDSLTITLLDSDGNVTDANGKLSGTGLTQIGVGTYSLAATGPAALTTELEGLTFTPTAHEGPAGSTITTNFSMLATDQFGATGTNSASVVATQSAPPPNPQIIGFGVTLITVPNTATIADGSSEDINDSGMIVGSYGLNNTVYGFITTNGNFQTILAPGSFDTDIQAVNNNGEYAGVFGQSPNGMNNPFVFHDGRYVNIPIATSSQGIGDINDKGQVAVNGSDNLAYIYDDNTGTLTKIPLTPAGNGATQVFGINNNGIAVGLFQDTLKGNTFGFIYDSNTGNVTKEQVNGGSTFFTAINDKNDIVGSTFAGQGFLIPVEDLNSVQDLGKLTDPSDINNNGLIVGTDIGFQHQYAYGGSLTNNQLIDFDPNNSNGAISAPRVNNNNVVAGSTVVGPGLGVPLPYYATPFLTT
jgi:VCBS repeat-containing protein